MNRLELIKNGSIRANIMLDVFLSNILKPCTGVRHGVIGAPKEKQKWTNNSHDRSANGRIFKARMAKRGRCLLFIM